LGTSVSAILFGGLYAVGITALYYDQRLRKEALVATLSAEAAQLT
jgi:hypothetical protein